MLPGTAGAAIDAETVISGKCTPCHGLQKIRDAQKTKEEWTIWVDKEVERGAQLSRSEKRAVVDWLAKNYAKTELAEVAQATEPEPPKEVEVAQAPAESLPFKEQAQTGVELWHFVVAGGALISGGVFLRRK